MIQCVQDIIHCRVRQTRTLEDSQPFLRRAFNRLNFNEIFQLLSISHSFVVGDELWVLTPVRLSQLAAKDSKESIVRSA